MTPEQAAFLRDHRLGVLATGRRDGSPQVSTVLYDFDGADVMVSVLRTSAKWRNVQRTSRVALAVLDGRAQLLCYGVAEPVAGGPERLAAMRRLRAKMRRRDADAEPSDAELEAALDSEGRMVIRILPDRVLTGA